MKFKKTGFILVFVMLFCVSSPVLADYRTGSATGDAVVYGAAGGALAGLTAWGISALSIACPPVAICAGVGAVGCAIYGANVKDKTLAKDAIALIGLGAAAPVTFTTAEKLGGTKAKEALTKGVINYGKKGVAGYGLNVVFGNPIKEAVQNCMEDWKKPSKPAQYADWTY